MSWEDGGPLDPPERRRARGGECPGCGYGPGEPHDCWHCENCGHVAPSEKSLVPCPKCGCDEWARSSDDAYVPIPDYDETDHDAKCDERAGK